MTVEYSPPDLTPQPTNPDLVAAVEVVLRQRDAARRRGPIRDPRDLAGRALTNCYGDRERAVEMLIGWSRADSADYEAITGLDRGPAVQPPEPMTIRPAATRHVDEAIARHGKKQPWPRRPAEPEPAKPRSGEDYAREALDKARENPPATSDSRWEVPVYESLGGSKTRLVGSQPVVLPAPTTEERAAGLLLGWCQQNGEIASAVFGNVQVHYGLGKRADEDRCLALIQKVVNSK